MIVGKLTSYEVEATGKWRGMKFATTEARDNYGRWTSGSSVGKKPKGKLPSETLRVNVRTHPGSWNITTTPIYVHQNVISKTDLILNPRSESGLKTRALKDNHGNIFAWDADETTHQQVELALRRRSIQTDGKQYYARKRINS